MYEGRNIRNEVQELEINDIEDIGLVIQIYIKIFCFPGNYLKNILIKKNSRNL
jgi:hypothetical protein